jgi:hypothetical protein
MTKLPILAILSIGTALSAMAEVVTLEVESVQYVEPNTYIVADKAVQYFVQAPKASALSDLQNLDAFSEVWFCSLEETEDIHTLLGCQRVPTPF